MGCATVAWGSGIKNETWHYALDGFLLLFLDIIIHHEETREAGAKSKGPATKQVIKSRIYKQIHTSNSTLCIILRRTPL